jgi:transposase
LFPENIGEFLSIDEVSLSKGELYTFVSNKAGKGKQGTIVAIIKGTRTQDIVSVLSKLDLSLRDQVKEVTLDMANNMESAIKQSFPKASLVTDRFHVIKLTTEALQHLRVKYRWQELDKENEAISNARKQGKKYKAIELENGDSPKQLLARCRYILTMNPNQWTKNQQHRAKILFEQYPALETAYKHVMEFKNIYELSDKLKAEQSFKEWINKTNEINIKEFNTVANTVKNNLKNIINFFDYRSTNANAESFNAKIKLFRANLRGVVDNKFFLFRLSKLFA